MLFRSQMNNELNTGKSSQCMIQREEKAYKEVTDLRAASEPFQPQQKTSSASKPRAWQLKRNDSRRRSPRPPHNRSRNGVRYDVDGSTENPIKHGFGVLMMVLKDIEFNRPLYYLTLPGSILGIIGLIMGVIFLREFILGKNLYFGPTMLMVLCIVIGSFMALMGIMLHSVSTILRDALKG